MKTKTTYKTIAAALLLGGVLLATPAYAQHRQPRSGQSGSSSSAPRERVSTPSRSSSSSVSAPRERVSTRSSSSSSATGPREQVSRPSTPRVSSSNHRDMNTTSGRDRTGMGRGSSNGSSGNHQGGNYGGRKPGGYSGGSHSGSGSSSGTTTRPNTYSGRGTAPDTKFNDSPITTNRSVTRSDSRTTNDNYRGGNRGGNDRDGNRGGNGNYGNRGGNDRDSNRGGNGNYGRRPGGNGGSNHGGTGNNFSNRNDHGGKDRPGGFNARPDNRPRHERPGGGDPGRFNRYNQYRYREGFRPHGPHHDRFYDHYMRGWNRPIMPPVRPYRHTLWYYRPTIPYGFRPYRHAPIVDGILGLFFGTLYDASLDYLYYNGFNIDGYYDNIVYLRDVPLFDYEWPDVMLRYDDYNQLNYAQFAITTGYNDRVRYNRLYRRLCDSYGTPVAYVRGSYPQVTWVGGDGRGYITLSLNHDAGRYYTALSFGY